MSFTPDEANDRLNELKSPVAKLLYVAGYCRYRNWLTGRTMVSNEKLAAQLGINRSYVSTAKTELLSAGWIVRDPENLQNGVIPVMGAKEFQQRRIWKFQNLREEEIWKFQNSREKIWNFQTQILEFPNLLSLSQYIVLPVVLTSNTTAAAATAISEDLEIPNLSPAPKSRRDSDSQPCDEAFVNRLIENGAYPPPLEPAHVRKVFRDLKFDAAERQPPVIPNRREFKGWLRQEAKEMMRRGQIELPNTGAGTFTQPQFTRPASTLSADEQKFLLPPDPSCQVCEGDINYRGASGVCVCRICQRCYGSGFEVVQGKGARKCTHRDSGESDQRQVQTG